MATQVWPVVFDDPHLTGRPSVHQLFWIGFLIQSGVIGVYSFDYVGVVVWGWKWLEYTGLQSWGGVCGLDTRMLKVDGTGNKMGLICSIMGWRAWSGTGIEVVTKQVPRKVESYRLRNFKSCAIVKIQDNVLENRISGSKSRGSLGQHLESESTVVKPRPR